MLLGIRMKCRKGKKERISFEFEYKTFTFSGIGFDYFFTTKIPFYPLNFLKRSHNPNPEGLV
jgi:hypothetical protein